MDEKKMNAMNEDALNEVAGGQTNFDFYGNPINVPVASVVNPQSTLGCSFKNGDGATYVCPNCGNSSFKICAADDRSVTLKCKKCGTKFQVANQ